MARKPVEAIQPVEDKYADDYYAGIYPWQTQAWMQLTTRFPSLPHGILLGGLAGTGKRRFANHLAAWLLCHTKTSEGACGKCSSCQWLKMGNNPNLARIEREVDDKGKQSKQIKIDQIRDLGSFVQQTSEGWRVVIIDPAESLNGAAANALLKTLEEPAPHVLLILITDQPMQLPATIRSRLQQIQVSRVPSDLAVAYVSQEAGLIPIEATQLLGLTGGSPLLALQLKDSPVYQARQDWFNDWQKLLQGRMTPLVLSTLWQKRLDLTQFLTLLQQMIRDALASQVGQTPLQQDIDFTVIKQYISPQKLMQLEQSIYHIMNAQNQNIQSGLVFDQLMGMLL